MNLVKVQESIPGRGEALYCLTHGRLEPIAAGPWRSPEGVIEHSGLYADLDGEPFKAYYCRNEESFDLHTSDLARMRQEGRQVTDFNHPHKGTATLCETCAYPHRAEEPMQPGRTHRQGQTPRTVIIAGPNAAALAVAKLYPGASFTVCSQTADRPFIVLKEHQKTGAAYAYGPLSYEAADALARMQNRRKGGAFVSRMLRLLPTDGRRIACHAESDQPRGTTTGSPSTTLPSTNE